MQPCKFRFDYPDTIYPGFAHGSTWNGFDNVAVTRETLDQIIQNTEDDETRAMFQKVAPMENGMYSLGWGFTTSIVVDIDAIKDSDIAAAVAMPDLDDACRHLQDIAGITDGGVASVCFSDINFDWAPADAADREEKVRAWLKSERNFQ